MELNTHDEGLAANIRLSPLTGDLDFFKAKIFNGRARNQKSFVEAIWNLPLIHENNFCRTDYGRLNVALTFTLSATQPSRHFCL